MGGGKKGPCCIGIKVIDATRSRTYEKGKHFEEIICLFLGTKSIFSLMEKIPAEEKNPTKNPDLLKKEKNTSLRYGLNCKYNQYHQSTGCTKGSKSGGMRSEAQKMNKRHEKIRKISLKMRQKCAL